MQMSDFRNYLIITIYIPTKGHFDLLKIEQQILSGMDMLDVFCF